MPGPNLALGVSAPGYRQVVDLANAVERLDGALARLGGGGASSLSGLAAINAEMQKIRQGMGEAVAGLRTDIAELRTTVSKAFTEGFNAVAQSANAGGKRVAKEVKEAAAETEAAAALYRNAAKQVAVAMNNATGEFTRFNPGTGVRGNLVQPLKAALEGIDKVQAAHMVQSAKIEQQRLDNQRAQFAAERTMMDNAVAQYRANRADHLRAQLDFEAKQKTAFLNYRDEQQARMGQERRMMDSAVAQYRARKASELEAQIAAETKQKALWVEHERARAERLAREATTMNGAVAQYRKIKADELAAQIAAEEKQKQLWFAHNEARRAQFAQEKFMMDGAVRQYRKFEAERIASIAASVNKAMLKPSGPFTSLVSGTVYGMPAPASDAQKLGAEAEKAAPKIKAMGDQMGYAHSAARGLASGFGAIWLTWGQIVPLLAGAALSHGFVSVIKTGSEVQHTFQLIRSLAGASANEVAALNAQMVDLAKNSQFGPNEIATAMKTLSLAGLDAAKVYASISDVLNFAVAGDTSIEKAADVMTTVATAFNVSAENYSYVGDTIAKAAAESKSSVESMGEAFKMASVINQQYGVSLEDTAVGLSLLANAGIQGTAAGTALRNMYVDLAGRTPKVVKALEKLKIETLDANGKMRDQAAIFKDLMLSMANFTPKSQSKILQDIFSERGGKEAVAILNALKQQADVTGTSIETVYNKLLNSITNAAGFTAISAAEVSLTAKNQLKSVMTTLQAVFSETFDYVQPLVADFAREMKSVFKSEGFKNTLVEMLTILGQTTLAVITHAKEIISLIALYAGAKGIAAAVTTAVTAFTAARAAFAAGAGALTMTAGAAGLMVPGLNVVIGLVTAAASAWALWTLWMGRSSDKLKETGSDHAKDLLQRLSEEADRLWKVNEARRQGISLLELEARVKAAALRNGETKEVAAARAALEEFDRKATTPSPLGRNSGDRARAIAAANSPERQRLVVAIEAAQSDARMLAQQAEQQAAKISALQAEQAEAERKRIAANRPFDPNGTQVWDLGNGRGNGKDGKGGDLPLLRDSTLATIRQEMDGRLSVLRDGFQKELSVISDRYRAEEMDAGQHMASMVEAARAQQTGTLKEIEESTVKFDKAYAERRETILKQFKGEAQTSRLRELSLEYDRFTAHVNTVLAKVGNDTEEKMTALTTTYERETNKLIKSNDDYWAKAEQTMNKEIAASQAKRDLANASEEVRVVAEAQARVEASHAVQLEKWTTELNKAELALLSFRKAYDDRDIGGASGEAAAALERRVAELRKQLSEGQSQVDRLKGVAGQDALNDLQNKRADSARRELVKMSEEVSGNLADAIMDGGKDGFESLADWAQEFFLRRPLKMVLQAALQPVGNLVASTMGNLFGVGGVQGGFNPGSLLLNGGSSGSGFLNSIGLGGGLFGSSASYAAMVPGLTMTGPGSQAAMLAAQTAEFGAAGLGATASAGGSALGGALSGLGAAMPWIGAGLAVASLFSKKRGGPKVEGFASTGGMSSGWNGPLNDKLSPLVQGVQAQFDAAVKAFGGTATGSFGLGASTDPKGTSPSFVEQRVLVNGRDAGYSMNHNVGRSDEELQAALDAAAKEMLVKALRASDLPGALGDLLRSTTDTSAAFADRINKIVTEKAALDARLFDLSATALEKLNKQRQDELAVIDEVNKSLLIQVHAQEDLNKAAADLVAAYENEASAKHSEIEELRNYARALRDWVKDAMLGENSPLGLFEKLAEATQQFDSTLALARGGDKDARSALTGRATNLVSSLRETSTSRVDFAMGFAKVASALTLEASGADAQATLLQEQLDVAKSQLEALGLINSSVMTFAQAWANYNNAKDNLAAATAAAEAAATQRTVAQQVPVAASGESDEDRFKRLMGGMFWGGAMDNTGYYGSAFANGGFHTGGLRLVGERGPELEVTGASYIHDAATTRRILSGGSNNDAAILALSMGLDALHQELVVMRKEAVTTRKTLVEFKDRGIPVINSPSGDALQTEAV